MSHDQRIRDLATAIGAGNKALVTSGGAETAARLAADTSLTTAIAAEAATRAAGDAAPIIGDDAISNAKLANMAANSVKVRAASTVGDPSDLALAASNLVGRGASGDIAAIGIGNTLEFNASLLETKWKEIFKGADTSRVSTTVLAADPELMTPVLVAGVYRLRGVFFFIENGSLAGMKHGFQQSGGGQANMGFFRGFVRTINGNASGTDSETVSIGNTSVGNVNSIGTAGGMGLARVEWDYQVQLTVAASIGLFWAQNTSDVNSLVCLAGSSIQYRRIS
ncbi:MAG: hypothetical protein FD163_2528 [Hyphomonadaceae bacterium]|nr:MAG: hypothetical protein FD128_2026 [Hyphomonadaceae bacterium]KAF0182663.1 MAG: hypothetical protein FD163_2528 [Hyphomonadaceae bacterium]